MGKSVLILDDDIDFNHLLTDIFKQADYEVTSERDPETAIQAFQERPYSLVVTDQKMPGLTGEEFIREIKKLRPGTPVIMVSGYLDNDTIRALIRDGVGGVFLKPLNVFSLLKRTAALIDKTEKTERAAVGGSEESEFTSFQHDLPFAFSAYACKAPKSTAFADKLFGLRNFKSNLLIIGRRESTRPRLPATWRALSPMPPMPTSFSIATASMKLRFTSSCSMPRQPVPKG